MKLFRGISGHRERSRKTNLEGMGMSDTDEDAEEKKKTSVDGNRENKIDLTHEPLSMAECGRIDSFALS